MKAEFKNSSHNIRVEPSQEASLLDLQLTRGQFLNLMLLMGLLGSSQDNSPQPTLAEQTNQPPPPEADRPRLNIDEYCQLYPPDECLETVYIPPDRFIPTFAAAERNYQEGQGLLFVRQTQEFQQFLRNVETHQLTDYGGGPNWELLEEERRQEILDLIYNPKEQRIPRLDDDKVYIFVGGEWFVDDRNYIVYEQKPKEDRSLNFKEASERPENPLTVDDLRSDYLDYSPLASAVEELHQNPSVNQLNQFLAAFREWFQITQTEPNQQPSPKINSVRDLFSQAGDWFEPGKKIFNPLLKRSPRMEGTDAYAWSLILFMHHHFYGLFENPEFVVALTQNHEGKLQKQSLVLADAPKIKDRSGKSIVVVSDNGALTKPNFLQTDNRAASVAANKNHGLKDVLNARGNEVRKVVFIQGFNCINLEQALTKPFLKSPVPGINSGLEDLVPATNWMPHLQQHERGIIYRSESDKLSHLAREYSILGLKLAFPAGIVGGFLGWLANLEKENI